MMNSIYKFSKPEFISKVSKFRSSNRHFSKQNNLIQSQKSPKFKYNLIYGTLLGASTLLTFQYNKDASFNFFKPLLLEQIEEHEVQQKPAKIYSLEEVRKHNSKENGVWVTWQNRVYDITDFIAGHPGGEKILLAAGGSVEPFWKMYAVHNNKEVKELIDEYLIGELNEKDAAKLMEKFQADDTSDPYEDEPDRHPVLNVKSAQPFNAEPPLELLGENFITPVDIWYVRNHLPVPNIKEEEYRLEIKGEGLQRKVYTLEELKNNFKQYTVVATLQCAGNRRNGMSEVKKVKGLEWEGAAIANAKWTGVRLIDLLEASGFNTEDTDNILDKSYPSHVQMEGYDFDLGLKNTKNLGLNFFSKEKNPYGASVPIEKVINPRGDVIVALEMNGNPLTRDHGFPCRVIVPGTVGARNVKWIKTIVVSTEESSSFWQKQDYKVFGSQIEDWNSADLDNTAAIQELPVQSCITEPKIDQEFDFEEIQDNGSFGIKGYAWSGGGRSIERLDISIDGGKTWEQAKLQKRKENTNNNRSWAWILWNYDIILDNNLEKKIKENNGNLEIICKAIDSSNNSQPENCEPIWNLRGLSNNSWHKVNVKFKL